MITKSVCVFIHFNRNNLIIKSRLINHCLHIYISIRIIRISVKRCYRSVRLNIASLSSAEHGNYYVSDTPKAGFKLHPAFYDENGNAVEYILLSAYEGVYFKDYLPDSSKARYITDALNTDTETNLEKDCILSYGDGKPISGLYKNITLGNAEKLCSNFGKGWHCETIKTLSANQMLMMIEFGMMNMQNAINKGIVNIEEVANANCAGNTGSTRNRGNATGTTAGTAFRFNSEIEPVKKTIDEVPEKLRKQVEVLLKGGDEP